MACNPLWNKTVLALKFEGTNGSTTFTDECGNTVTAYANAQISTAQSKYGNSSGKFDGANDYISAAGQTGMGTGDYTINMDVYLNSYVQGSFWESTPIGGAGARNSSFVWYLLPGGTMYFFTNGGNRITTSASIIPLTTWTNLICQRYSGVTTIYVNETSVGSTSASYNDTAGGAIIGTFCDATTVSLDGYVDNFYAVKGKAALAAGLTTPNAALLTNQCKIAGVTRNGAGALAQRLVRVFSRSNASLVGEVVSTAGTGAYSIDVEFVGECFVVEHDATATPPSGGSENADILDLVVPV